MDQISQTGRAGVHKRPILRKIVRGKSFVDVGGLWKTLGEMVTTAVEGGASRVAMADIQAPGNEWWVKFEAHCAEKGVSGCEMIHVDICAPEGPSKLGKFDVVHCSGIMYHVPDLFRFLGNLVECANEYLMLGSVVMPDSIENEFGRLDFPEDAAYLAPLLSSSNAKIVSAYLDSINMKAAGLNSPASRGFFVNGRPIFGPWWWLFSGTFMSRLIHLVGMEVVEEGPTPDGRGYIVVARH
ncbi:hypothetical protein [Desulfarculus baarsii]